MTSASNNLENVENSNPPLAFVLRTWCNTNDLVVNLDKSKLVHFRTQSRIRTDFQFSLNGNSLEAVSQYMYLGL
jgi:hypothetical protein